MRLDDGLPIIEAIDDRKGQSVLGLKFVLPLQCHRWPRGTTVKSIRRRRSSSRRMRQASIPVGSKLPGQGTNDDVLYLHLPSRHCALADQNRSHPALVPGEGAVEDERAGSLEISRGKQHAHRAAFGDAEERGALATGGIHYRAHVVHLPAT